LYSPSQKADILPLKNTQDEAISILTLIAAYYSMVFNGNPQASNRPVRFKIAEAYVLGKVEKSYSQGRGFLTPTGKLQHDFLNLLSTTTMVCSSAIHCTNKAHIFSTNGKI
jgi:hypothetical protein